MALVPQSFIPQFNHSSNVPSSIHSGARFELASSKLIYLSNNFCYESIPTGITIFFQQRQDFLIIGKASNKMFGLSVLPAVVNCNEELIILALTFNVPMIIP